MIKISGSTITRESVDGDYLSANIEREIIECMAISSAVYAYDSSEQLKFELKLRKNIVAAAKALNQSGVTFAIFQKSKCNSAYWNLTSEGGFQLKQGVKSSTAIADIFKNGSKYAFECATAMVIVYYKAVLDVFSRSLFNQLFAGIYLMDWESDPDLKLTWRKESDYLAGDRRYFKNPDVNPKMLWWQGENVIDLGNGSYYGHGIGIKTANEIIAVLNGYRKLGAKKSAYLMDKVGRPNFQYLWSKYQGSSSAECQVGDERWESCWVNLRPGYRRYLCVNGKWRRGRCRPGEIP